MKERISLILRDVYGETIAHLILKSLLGRVAGDIDGAVTRDLTNFLKEAERSIGYFANDAIKKSFALRKIEMAVKASSQSGRIELDSAVIQINREPDIVSARATARDFCVRAGFRASMQIQVATAASELARNIVQYAGCGEMRITLIKTPKPGVEITAIDEGPGIAELDKILSGQYKSRTGMGLGLLGTKRMMDFFNIANLPSRGTEVTIRKFV